MHGMQTPDVAMQTIRELTSEFGVQNRRRLIGRIDNRGVEVRPRTRFLKVPASRKLRFRISGNSGGCELRGALCAVLPLQIYNWLAVISFAGLAIVEIGGGLVYGAPLLRIALLVLKYTVSVPLFLAAYNYMLIFYDRRITILMMADVEDAIGRLDRAKDGR